MNKPTPPVRVLEEWICPKCDSTHYEEREDPQIPTKGTKQCPCCGFKKSLS
jgi:hypothetical protein